MAQVFVGIGSNSEPEWHVAQGVQALAQRYGQLRCSSVYASAPIGCDGPEFLNLVVALQTEEPVEGVAARLKALEQQYSRTPRALDLDLLLYDDLILDTPQLRLPRSDIQNYAFVLRPLAELAPAMRHPVSGRCLAELWADFPAAAQPLRQVEVALW